MAKAINEQVARDLSRSESIAIPVTLILLIVVFGSLVAAGMPLLVGIGAILGSFFVLFATSLVTDVSIFAVNLVTGLGLGLGIDYALLMVSRFREELHGDESVGGAVERTVASAGRTVVFSGLTVAVTLASMAFFPLYFLRSFAYAGISVVFFAVLGALITLPAALGVLGPRINALRIRRNAGTAHEGTRWAALATAIMRHPWPVAVGSIALLLVLAWPALDVRFGQLDERALPASDAAVVATNTLRADYPELGGAPIDIMVPGPVADDEVAAYAAALSRIESVTGRGLVRRRVRGRSQGGAAPGDPRHHGRRHRAPRRHLDRATAKPRGRGWSSVPSEQCPHRAPAPWSAASRRPTPTPRRPSPA